MWETQGAEYTKYMKLNIISGKYRHDASRPDLAYVWLAEIIGSIG